MFRPFAATRITPFRSLTRSCVALKKKNSPLINSCTDMNLGMSSHLVTTAEILEHTVDKDTS